MPVRFTVVRGSWRSPCLYRDGLGELRGVLASDGTRLELELRGVEFMGRDFDALEPVACREPAELARFRFASGCLCSCRLELGIPIRLRVDAAVREASLDVELVLGDPRPDGGLQEERLRLALELDGRVIASSGRSAWFEDELSELAATLPPETRFASCFSCCLSDYSPYGHAIFGALACFRDVAAEYRAVSNKVELFALWDKHSGFVQETALCERFEPRRPGTGYRG